MVSSYPVMHEADSSIHAKFISRRERSSKTTIFWQNRHRRSVRKEG